MKTVRPKVLCSVAISSSNSAAPIGSRPEVGSSRNTISGSSASARASAARLIMPPDSSEGSLSAASGLQADQLDLEHARARPSAARTGRDTRASAPGCSASRSARRTARRAGTARPSAARSPCARRGDSASTFSPNTSIVPARFGIRPRMVRVSTDLPVPERADEAEDLAAVDVEVEVLHDQCARRSRPRGRARG